VVEEIRAAEEKITGRIRVHISARAVKDLEPAARGLRRDVLARHFPKDPETLPVPGFRRDHERLSR
jgi:hypothetical protein